MNIAEQIKWLNENEEWVESLKPISVELDVIDDKVNIHADTYVEGQRNT